MKSRIPAAIVCPSTRLVCAAAQQRMHKRLSLRMGLLGVVLLTGLAGCKNPASATPASSTIAAQNNQAQAVSPASATSAVLISGLPDFTPLVERVGPSVVNIRVMEKVNKKPSAIGSGDPMEELLRRFFGIRPEQLPRRNQPLPEGGDERPAGIGSGFIISPDGYIMTNAHVVDDADSLVVTLADKREFRGKMIGKDLRTDVAVVKIDGKELPTVQVGNVDSLKVGQWVMAIGSPFGLDNSVTVGVVSAKQRDTGEYLPFIQSDVAINPGNSGGPLINMAGEVVGINSQIYSRSGGYMGISFSIPIDEAMRIAEQLRTSGTVTRGRIGVQIAPLGKEVAGSMGLTAEQGALVRSVESGAPADQAGIEPGDIITKVNGKTIERTSDLPRMIGEIKPGTRITLTLLRNASSKDVSVTVAKAEEEGRVQPLLQQQKEGGEASSALVNALGLEPVELTAAQRSQFRLNGGVIVRRIIPASPAEQAGLRAGDIILALGNHPINSIATLNAAIGKMPSNRPVPVLIQRDGMAQYGMIRLR